MKAIADTPNVEDKHSDGGSDPIGRLLKIDDVCKDVGLSRAMIYRCIRRSDRPFPRPVKIGYASRWRQSDIVSWKRALPTPPAE